MAVRIRVVIDRVRLWIVVINASRLIDDHLFGLVIGHVNDFIVNRINLDDAIVIGDGLVLVGFQVAGGVCAIATRLSLLVAGGYW